MLDAKDLIPLLVALITVGATIGIGLISKKSKNARFFSEEKDRLALIDLAKTLGVEQDYPSRNHKQPFYVYVLGFTWFFILFLAVYIILQSTIKHQTENTIAEKDKRIQERILAKRKEIGMLWSNINERADFLYSYCNNNLVDNSKLKAACEKATLIWTLPELDDIGNIEMEIRSLYIKLNGQEAKH